MGTRSRSGRATDRDLRSARAATLKATKKKVATAWVGAGIQKKKRPAGASEKTLSEATEILRLKREAFGATPLLRKVGVPGALERWLKAREEEARAEEAQPKKMVLKTKVPEAVIQDMKLHPYCCIDPMTDEELANRSEWFRQLYAMVRFVDQKMNDYRSALIELHNNKGYAEDETEVSDDEEVQID